MRQESDSLKLGKGAAFAKSRLKSLRQEAETWEADFRALPAPITQSETHYLGLVVKKPGGSTLAEMEVKGRPSADDLATLLAHGMRRPLTGRAHRPSRVQVRGRRQWQELFPPVYDTGRGQYVLHDEGERVPGFFLALEEEWANLPIIVQPGQGRK